MTDIEGIKQRKKYIVEQYQPRLSNPIAISRFSRANEPFVESAQPSARNSVQRYPFVPQGPSKQRIASAYHDKLQLQGGNFMLQNKV